MFFDASLWQFTRGLRHRIAVAVVIGVAAAVVGIVRLALLGWLLAKVYAGAAFAELILPIAGVAAVMLLRGALEYWRALLAHETAGRVQQTLRERLYDKIVELGPAYFGQQRTGAVLLSIVEGVEQLETYFGQYLPQLIIAFITPLIVFLLMAWLDFLLALVFLGFALLTLILPSAWHKLDSASSRRRQQAYAAFAAEFLDSIQGLATLKAFGQSGARGRQLATKAHEVFRSTMWVLATNSLNRGITDTGLAVGAAVALVYGAYRVNAGSMSLEILLMILMMGIEVFRPQRDLRTYLHQGMVGQAAAQGIVELLRARPLVEAAGRGELPATARRSVEFNQVDFTYPGSERAAHVGLTFKVEAGERVSFVGASGAGKSTIVKLLLRQYNPEQGEVLIGGQPVATLTADAIYRQVALVQQDPYLFHGTVAENLRYGRSDADQGALEAAARVANADDFIRRLPSGYATVIGERGVRLSGGQRQRIAIARAVLKDSPILILDEALSAVDAANEAVIQQALDRLMQGRTTLIFAHRLSSVINSDRIIVLQNGRVVESGRHRDLLAADGVYHDLMIEQARESRSSNDTADLLPGAQDSARALFPATEDAQPATQEPSDAILRAEGLGIGQVLRILFRYVKPWSGKLGLTFMFGVSRVLALVGVGVFSGLIVAAVKNGEPYNGFVVGLLCLAPLAGVLHWLESWLAHDMAFRLLAQMRIDLFAKLDRLAPAYLVRRRTGDLVAMATHDVELIEYFFAHTVAPAFVAVLVPALVLTALLYAGWPLALALLPFLILVGLSPLLGRRRVDRLGARAREALASLNAHTVDTLQGLSEIVAFRQTAVRRQGFCARIGAHLRIRLAFFRDLTLQTALLEVATGLGGLAVVTTGAYLVGRGALDAAVLPLLTLLALAAFLPVSEIAHVGRQLADTLGATRRLYAVHNEEVAVSDGAGVAAEPGFGGPVLSVQGVSFAYLPHHRPALTRVSFDVAAGATVALVGSSGAGKTTLAHLFLRFWDPQEGRISLNGIDLRAYRLDELRERVALVSQDTYLFNSSLRENILMARPQASENDLRRALDQASLRDFVDGLPDGLETQAGERGVRLSGGQRQRIAIARAFLKDAPILILDEATSHLDAVNEQAVRKGLQALMKNRTTIVIAHRLSTVRDADLIVALDAGRVVEVGRHDDLIARRGFYAALVGQQLAAAAAD